MKLPVRVNLDEVHITRNPARFRRHLSAGLVASTLVGLIGTAYGVPWCLHLSLVMQAGTSLLWVWE